MKWTSSKQFKRMEQKPCLAVGDEVVFVVGKESHVGLVSDESDEYFIDINSDNSLIFTLLGIKKVEYVKDIQGYVGNGVWPYSKTLQDLTKVVKAVLKDCEKHNAKLEEEKEAEPRKGSLENPWAVADYKNLLTDLPVGDHYKFKAGEILQRVK